MMESISTILNYIGRTNLFNFIIFLSIFILIFKKAKLGDKLEGVKNNIVEHIEDSKSAKSESESQLKEIEETLSHIEEEIESIIKKSEKNAKLVGEKILDDAKVMVESIKDNSNKSIENKTALLKNDIMKRASLASIEVAKKHIVNELNNNYDLHNKLIDESLEALNNVEGVN